MKKIAVVYFSGTGNTEAMAHAVAEGAQGAGADVSLFTCDAFSGDVASYDALAFGCPAMGAEQLEEGSFEPMFEGCKDALAGKTVGLFGSYGWGGGEWMETWADDCRSAGIVLVSDPVICNEAPDGDALAACSALGAALA